MTDDAGRVSAEEHIDVWMACRHGISESRCCTTCYRAAERAAAEAATKGMVQEPEDAGRVSAEDAITAMEDQPCPHDDAKTAFECALCHIEERRTAERAAAEAAFEEGLAQQYRIDQQHIANVRSTADQRVLAALARELGLPEDRHCDNPKAKHHEHCQFCKGSARLPWTPATLTEALILYLTAELDASSDLTIGEQLCALLRREGGG